MIKTAQHYIKILIGFGRTETWVAEKSKVSQSTINKIKNGHIQCSSAMAKKIEKTYQKYGKKLTYKRSKNETR